MDHKFQINLRGIIDLLSNHLYSNPGVYVRELLQNGVDAISARRGLEPEHRGRVSIQVGQSDAVEQRRAVADAVQKLGDEGRGVSDAHGEDRAVTWQAGGEPGRFLGLRIEPVGTERLAGRADEVLGREDDPFGGVVVADPPRSGVT